LNKKAGFDSPSSAKGAAFAGIGCARRNRSKHFAVKPSRALLVALAGFLLLSSSSFAVTSWIRDTGDFGSWFDDLNWSNGVPDAFTDAQINNGGFAIVNGGEASDAYAASITLGFGLPDSGTLALRGGVNLHCGEMTVGNSGTGSLQFVEPSSLYNDSFILGESAGSHGEVTGVDAHWENTGQFVIGQAGTGQVSLDEAFVSSASCVIGAESGSVGYLRLGFSTFTVHKDLVVGQHGTGTFLLGSEGFTNASAGNAIIGEFAGSSGTVTVPGAHWSAGNIYVGGNASGAGGTGLLRVNGGGTVETSNMVVWQTGTLEVSNFATLTGPLTFEGGTLRFSDNATFANNAALGTQGVTVDSNGFNSTLTGSFNGSGGLRKIGAGSIALTNANTYSGPTSVENGTLLVNGSITSAVTVKGGTLGGTGTVGNVTVEQAGTLSPGASPGILHVSGNLQLNLGAVYLVDINGAAVGVEYDQTQVDGTVMLGGATLTLQLGYLAQIGTQFVIIDNDSTDSIGSIFDQLPEGSSFTVDGQAFQISYQGGDGNDVELTAVVPEPHSWLLLCAGFAALVLISCGKRVQACEAVIARTALIADGNINRPHHLASIPSYKNSPELTAGERAQCSAR
jgi:fibronectin-binding autotransporter adhesin